MRFRQVLLTSVILTQLPIIAHAQFIENVHVNDALTNTLSQSELPFEHTSSLTFNAQNAVGVSFHFRYDHDNGDPVSQHQVLFDSRNGDGNGIVVSIHPNTANNENDYALRVALKDPNQPASEIFLTQNTISTSGSNLVFPDSFADNQTHHFALTVSPVSGNNVVTYSVSASVNGQPLITGFSSTEAVRDSLSSITFGGTAHPTSTAASGFEDAFDGYIDEIKIWDGGGMTTSLHAELLQDACTPLNRGIGENLPSNMIRLGGYVWKGGGNCYVEKIAKSFDLLASRFIPDDTSTDSLYTVASDANSSLIKLAKLPTSVWSTNGPANGPHTFTLSSSDSAKAATVPQEDQVIYMTEDVSKAELRRPDGENIHAEIIDGAFESARKYDPSHTTFSEQYSNYLYRTYMDSEAEMDGFVFDEVPWAVANFWRWEDFLGNPYSLNLDMRTRDKFDNPNSTTAGTIYNASKTRRTHATRAFINSFGDGVGRDALNDVIIAPNLTGHETDTTSHNIAMNNNPQSGGMDLKGGWFENWITKYNKRRCLPTENGQTTSCTAPSETDKCSAPPMEASEIVRQRDFALAAERSKATTENPEGIAVIAAYAFDVNCENQVETMIAAYLTATSGKRFYLHPKPVDIDEQDDLYENNYFLGQDFSLQNSPATWGYSFKFLFDSMNRYREYFELDIGGCDQIDTDGNCVPASNASSYSYIRKFKEGFVIFNVGNAQKTISQSSLFNDHGIAFSNYSRFTPAQGMGTDLVLPAMTGQIFVKTVVE